MKILSIGYFSSSGISNTSLHRNWALKKISDVTEIDESFKWNLIRRIINRLYVRYKIPIGYIDNKINRKIINTVKSEKFNIIWIDKGNYILPTTLKKIKKLQESAIIIGYSPDNMAERHNQTKWFVSGLKYYDWFITNKSYILDWYKSMGCKNVLFVNNAYEEKFHYPRQITIEDKERLGGCIGFIGMWEKERCESILYLVDHGLPVRVWGGGKWIEYKKYSPLLKIEDEGLFSEDYPKALSAFDISLCFLRKMNYDLQTTRTMEIPACGSLLMAERTSEHEALFKDGEEAVFFSSNQELLEKCIYYINKPNERNKIIKNGLNRCEISGYSNSKTINRALKYILKNYEKKL